MFQHQKKLPGDISQFTTMLESINCYQEVENFLKQYKTHFPLVQNDGGIVLLGTVKAEKTDLDALKALRRKVDTLINQQLENNTNDELTQLYVVSLRLTGVIGRLNPEDNATYFDELGDELKKIASKPSTMPEDSIEL